MYASPLLTLPGAVPAEGSDAGVAAHYGDPFREQRALTERAGVVDRSHRAVLTVSGPDRLSWLHSITTQHLSALPAWRGIEALVLSPHGHVEHHLLVLDDGQTSWLDVEPGTAGQLLGYLESMRFMLRVEPRDVTADWALVSVVGPATPAVLKAVGPVPDGPYDAAPLPGGGWVRRMPWPGVDAADLLVPRASLAATVDQLADAGAAHCGVWAYEALRVEAGRPRLGHETDHRTIVQEVNWVDAAVHLNKGCYRGQETVARVQNLGRPPRRLVRLHLDGSVEKLPATGDQVMHAGSAVGTVTTAVRHHELGPIALALIKRNTPEDAVLVVGEVAAAIDGAVAAAAIDREAAIDDRAGAGDRRLTAMRRSTGQPG